MKTTSTVTPPNRIRRQPLPLPIERGSLAGPNLTALIAFMKGVCHASYSTIQKFLRDVIGVQIERSTLCKIVNKVSRALEGTYEELLVVLPFTSCAQQRRSVYAFSKDAVVRWFNGGDAPSLLPEIALA